MSFVSRLERQENVNTFTIFDHYYAGGVSYRGEINQVWGKDALINAVKMWFGSLFGEIIRQRKRGGIVRDILMKPMNQVDSKDVEMAIRDGFDQDFIPFMQINEISVTPDYDNNKWTIYIKFYCPKYKILSEISEDIKAAI